MPTRLNPLWLTIVCSGVTTGVGLAACPMQSLALQHWFLYLSVATVAGMVVSFSMHALRRTPFQDVMQISVCLAPFLLIWLVNLLWPQRDIREAGARYAMFCNGKGIAMTWYDYEDAEKRLPANIQNPAGEPLLSWRVSILPFIYTDLICIKHLT